MRGKTLAFVAGGAALLVAGVAFASGDDGPGGGSLDPEVKPPTPGDLPGIKANMCTVFRAGTDELGELVRATLAIVYPDTDWGVVADSPLESADPGTAETIDIFRELATELLSLDSDAQRQAWCDDGIIDPVEPPMPDDDDDAGGGGGGGGQYVPPYDYGPEYQTIEHSEAVAAYSDWQNQDLGPAGPDEVDYLADKAYEATYPDGPNPIGGTTGKWKDWADAWKRIHAIIETLAGS